MLVTTETASVEHIDRLCEIEIRCFEREAFTKQQITYLLNDSNSVNLLSRVKDEIVGFVISRTCMDKKPAIGHILTIDVLFEYRRKGIGQKLLQEIEKIFKQRGIELCFLEVRENNIVALSLYQKLGYKEVERLKDYYINAHGIRLGKVLT